MSADPTPTHYPQCPYCNAEWSGKGYYVCGTFNNSGCHDTFPQSTLCKERAAHADTQKAFNAMRESMDEANERLAALNEWVGFHAGELNNSKSELAATKRELSNATDTLDLMRDEFQRIRARIVEKGCDETRLGNEILELCTRAMSGITQRIPVIAQRDSAEARVAELEGLLKSFKQIFRRQMVGDDPLGAKCVFCSYNGPGYWQPGTHSKSCPWHSVGGMDERRKKLSCLTLGQAMPAKEVV